MWSSAQLPVLSWQQDHSIGLLFCSFVHSFIYAFIYTSTLIQDASVNTNLHQRAHFPSYQGQVYCGRRQPPVNVVCMSAPAHLGGSAYPLPPLLPTLVLTFGVCVTAVSHYHGTRMICRSKDLGSHLYQSACTYMKMYNVGV